MVDLDRVSDLELLRTVAKVQDAQIRRLSDKLILVTRELATANKEDTATLQKRLALLEKEVQEVQERAYGHQSERRPRTDKPSKEKKLQTGHGPTPQPDLPTVTELHLLDEPDRACPSCGGELKPWLEQFEESEEVDVVDVKYILKKHRRQKYRCGCGGCIETALGPIKLLQGGRYSLAFAVHVTIEKYCVHMPLERQAKRIAWAGLDVTTQTLGDQLYALSRCFSVAIKRLHEYLLKKEVLMGDETRWPLLGVKGRASKNWLDCVLVADDAVLHSIHETRSNDAAREVLTGFKGTLLTDGYGVYSSVATELGYTQAHDWCHARRYFIEAEATAPDEAGPILDDIGKLFLIERDIVTAFTGYPLQRALEIRRAMRGKLTYSLIESARLNGLDPAPLPPVCGRGASPGRGGPVAPRGWAGRICRRWGGAASVATDRERVDRPHHPAQLADSDSRKQTGLGEHVPPARAVRALRLRGPGLLPSA